MMTALQITSLDNRSLLKLTGADVFNFLQNLITNDMEQVSDSRAIYAALLTAQGKFLHDFFVLKWGDAFWIDVSAARKDDLVRRLTMYKLRADVTIATDDFDLFALYGETAIAAAGLDPAEGTVRPEGSSLYFVDPRLAELGVRIIAPRGTSPTFEADDAAYEHYDTHRLALGIPDGGTDIVPEKNFLLEANFEELHGVSFTKGCYVGQELTARTKHRAKIRKRLYRFTSETPLASGDSITLAGKEIAEIRSVDKAGTSGIALSRIEPLTDVEPAEIEPAGVVLSPPDYISTATAES